MLYWPPDKVTVAQFAGRVRQYLGDGGVIFTPEVTWEYRIDAGYLCRVKPDGKRIASVEDAASMDDETLVARCKEA